jgi:hypothetical protein
MGLRAHRDAATTHRPASVACRQLETATGEPGGGSGCPRGSRSDSGAMTPHRGSYSAALRLSAIDRTG